MKVTWKITWQMDSESSLIKLGTSMKVNGRITWLMEEGRLFIVTKASTMGSSSTIKGMEMESSCRICVSLKDSLWVINFRALLPCRIKTDRAIPDNGRIIKNIGKECISGRTATGMKASTNAEKEKGLESCFMPTDRPMKEIGLMGWKKATEYTRHTRILSKASGEWVISYKKRSELISSSFIHVYTIYIQH